jgi:uncharacterized alpha-E superfamily protein
MTMPAQSEHQKTMLLSRVADSLYWMSRYLERAEHTARLIDVSLNLMLEQAPHEADLRWRRVLRSLNVPLGDTPLDAYHLTYLLTFDGGNPNSIVSCIAAARENAQHVRELLSSEMWEQLNLLYLHVRRTRLDDIWNDRPSEFFRSVRDGAHLFQGITDSTMTQGEGWQFIQVGRLLERASAVAALVVQHFSDTDRPISAGESSTEHLEWIGLLKSCTAFEAYCKVYTADLQPNQIVEFLVLNPDFPHSICFAALRLQGHLQGIAASTETHNAGRVTRLAGRLRATLEFGQTDEIMEGGLQGYLEQVQALCRQIHDTIYQAYITYAIDRELAT